MKPALFVQFPTLRWRPPKERYPLVRDAVRKAAPALRHDFDVLDGELVPEFYRLDDKARRMQNTFRLGQVFVIVGGAAATSLGAVQAALGGGVLAIGVAEALVAGTLTFAAAYLRGSRVQREYFTARLQAERLRREYFLFLGRIEPYDLADDKERLRRLREQVVRVEAEEPV